MDQNLMLWLAILVTAILIEVGTMQIISIWFAIGAVGAMLMYGLGANLGLQILMFAIISALSLLLLRPCSKWLLKKPSESTNADSLVGKHILITQDVNNIEGTGEGKYNGQFWTVRSEHDNITMRKGEIHECLKIEGVKLIVK